jgi:tryptophan synthase beta chain
MSVTTEAFFGAYGGRYVPEVLVPALEELERGYAELRSNPTFRRELDDALDTFAGRPTPITRAAGLDPTKRIFLKREDLAHTGAHKINNAIGQALLARFLGKRRIVAETGAGQHGVEVAAACARVGLECEIYMGATDVERQHANVERIKLLGGTIHSVENGAGTLREAISEAIRDWLANVDTTHYLIGSCVGPHPYPKLVAELQSVIGREARAQILNAAGRLPDVVVACVGGGSNAIGLFDAFLGDANVKLIGVEAAGAASLGEGRPVVLHGARTLALADEDGQVEDAHSVAAGLDYPGVGPQHAALRDSGRAEYVTVNDTQAVNAFRFLSRSEGIIPALESSHAVAAALELDDELILVGLSGRGDKDLGVVGA